MNADLINLLEGCPAKCGHLDLNIENVERRVEQFTNVAVIVDCSHREVCGMRKKGDGDDVLLG